MREEYYLIDDLFIASVHRVSGNIPNLTISDEKDWIVVSRIRTRVDETPYDDDIIPSDFTIIEKDIFYNIDPSSKQRNYSLFSLEDYKDNDNEAYVYIIERLKDNTIFKDRREYLDRIRGRGNKHITFKEIKDTLESINSRRSNILRLDFRLYVRSLLGDNGSKNRILRKM